MELCNEYPEMLENIIEQGIKYLERYPKIETMVVGLSGGIDSTLTAAIAREICDRTNKHKLIGYSIPIETNKPSEILNARDAGNSFCHKFIEIKWLNIIYPIVKWIFFNKFKKSNDFNENVRFGNIKARLRMIYLYDRSSRYKGIVLSTDNLTEFNLGFWTLHGDVGDVGFIQQLWKTEVYGIAHFLFARYSKSIMKQSALIKAINAIPTDGLGITDSDFDQIGVSSYEEIDNLLIEYIKTGSKNKILEKHPVIRRHLTYDFKRKNPYSISRESIIPKPSPVILDLI